MLLVHLVLLITGEIMGEIMTGFKQEFLLRQSDLIPAEVLNTPIVVIGAGAIGSHSVMALTRMGFCNIEVWDFDEVSEENMNNQGYDVADIGRPKVEALKDKVEKAMGLTIRAVPMQCKPNHRLKGIVIAAVDSMKVRKFIWGSGDFITYYIDPRMGAEYAKMYVMRPHDAKDSIAYTKTLYTDDEAIREPCTAKSTIYTAYLISGLVAKAVKDIVCNKPYTRVVEWDIAKNKMMAWNVDGS